MYDYLIYKTKQGKDEISEYLEQLSQRAKNNKDARIKLSKIIQCLDLLTEYGTRVGEPYTKHIDEDIWELRPTSDRIFYAYWKDNTFILLHHFKKKTQKTPSKEIEQAKRNLKDWKERNDI